MTEPNPDAAETVKALLADINENLDDTAGVQIDWVSTGVMSALDSLTRQLADVTLARDEARNALGPVQRELERARVLVSLLRQGHERILQRIEGGDGGSRLIHIQDIALASLEPSAARLLALPTREGT